MGEMSWSVAKSAIDRNVENGLCEVIPSTMGEPLLYLYFGELVDYCADLHIPLNLTTNGSFPGKWGSVSGMSRLLQVCRDIKVSCMGFDCVTMAEMMPGLSFERWRKNVEKILDISKKLRSVNAFAVSTVSLQVTLHKKMLSLVRDVLAWAENIGISRIKWNLPVFMNCGEELRSRYGIDQETVKELRRRIKSNKVCCEGSLFFEKRRNRGAGRADDISCQFFKDEIWVLPDGSEQYCPNPERRFGDKFAAGATCAGCPLFQ